MSETNFETNETGAAAAQRVEDANVNDDSSNPSSPSPSLSSASSTSSEEKMEIAHAPSSPLAMNNEQQQPQLSAQPQAAPSQQQQQHQQVAPQSPQPQVQHHQQQQQLHHQQQQQQQQHQSAPANAGSGMQQYCVSWNSYASHLQGAFPKLLSSEQFVDVSLACDGGSFKCHKVVLSACSEYMERILLDLPCQHPVIFMTNMEYWELQALIQFMYHGEVYVEEAKLRQLLKAADALQIRGLSGKNTDLNGAKDEHNTHNNIHQQHAHHSTPKVPTSNAASTPSASSASSTAGDFPQADDNSADGSDCDLHNIIPTLPAGTTAVPTSENLSYDTEPIQEDMHHSYDMSLAGGSCETSVVEGPGTVKLEPDDHHHNMMGYNDKNNYSVNMVPVNASCQPSSPFPAIEGNDFVGPRHKNIQNGQNGRDLSYQKRQRRSEAELKLAADLVSRGMTFQVASEQYSIPISTIRFYMARKGILQRRKRGRGSNTNVNNSAMMSSNNIMNNQPNSPTGNPPFHMMNYRLPESLNSSLQ